MSSSPMLVRPFAGARRRAAFVAAVLAGPAAALAPAQQFQEQTATRFPSPNPAEYTNYVAVGDIDGDGDLDLCFANGGNFGSVGSPQLQRIYVNDGSANFADETVARIGNFTGNYRGVAMGDIDGDGDLDLLYSSDFGRQPKLFVNDGAGTFSDETDVRLPMLLLSSTRAAFVDLDDDGDLDVYINNGGLTNRFGCGQNRVLMNDGNGVFVDETNARHPLGNVCDPMDAIVADVDGDLDLDVRTANLGTNNSKLYLNDGSGVLADASAGLPGDSTCYSYDYGDMDGDGDLDLLGANAGQSNRELLLGNQGGGVFDDQSNRLQPNTTGDDNDSKFVDIDMDGDLDLVIASLYQSREKIYRFDGNRFNLESGAITSNSDATLDVEVADLDGDGDYDLVTAQGESGSFVNRIYMNETGPADTLAPRIVNLGVTGDLDQPGPWAVRAMILDEHTSDRGFHDRGVSLSWIVDGGGGAGLVPMTWVGNSMWRAELPALAPGSSVTLEVSAEDFAGNVGTSDPLAIVIGGTPLQGDLDGDGDVDFDDLLALLAAWGPCGGPPCPADLDGDGTVGFPDLLIVLTDWS